MSRKHNNFSIRRHFDMHSDRGFGSDQTIRRVSFKNNFGKVGKSKRQEHGSLYNRIAMMDDDVVMGAGAGGQSSGGGGGLRRQFPNVYRKVNYRGNNTRGRPGSPGMWNRSLGPFECYLIRICHGAKYEKQYLLKLLLDFLSPNIFIPISYGNQGNDAVFYIDNFGTAQLLLNANRKIVLKDGHKMRVMVREGRPPLPPLNDEMKERLQAVMVSRFIAANKALDLSRFLKDPGLEGQYFPLSRPSVLGAVCQIINDNISDLVALDLTGNYIYTLDEVAPQLRKLKSLRILHLGENNFRSLHALNGLRGLEITELVLEKNPVCNNFSDKAHVVSEVRKRFPKLQKLDNVELPPIISFDIGEDTKLPEPQASFISNPEGRPIVKAFLQQYFALYDTDDRHELAQAYHDDALFSYCCSYPASQPNSTTYKLTTYMAESRNLLRVLDYRGRKDKLWIGKSAIVAAVKILPRSQHDLTSFVVDLTLFTPELLCLSVSGVFREPSSGPQEEWPVRSFNRTFLIIPVGQGFCITNELFYVTNATTQQKASAFRTEIEKQVILQSPPNPATALPSASGMSPVSPASPAVLDESVKIQMVMMLSTQSGMNLEWSQKCLNETQWDFQRALWTFTELQKQGTIPPEAFIK